jgi:2-polyprenyl-3-methyl-5-hydroxy-6-metoxy-1,4-benzoquinol methylase
VEASPSDEVDVMRQDAIRLEEKRLQDVNAIQDYPDFHERHRVFPAVFENRQHKRIFDVAAGVGCAAQRVRDHYPAEILCNEITPKCLKILEQLGLPTVSFDLDNEQAYPFPDGHFDAVISLSTIEHLIHVDHFVKEIHRILSNAGYLYLSSPNYASMSFFPRFVLAGKTFHDPLSESLRQRYEFYAHVRYFTYTTLLEFVSSFGFIPDAVYLPLPAGSTRYQALYARSKPKALAFRYVTWLMYHVLSPRWASEPILCFQKASSRMDRKVRKVVL